MQPQRLFLPPWLLLSIGAFLALQTRQVPNQFLSLSNDILGSVRSLLAATNLIDLTLPVYKIMLRIATASSFWIPVAIFLIGLVDITFPRRRAARVERRFQLDAALPPTSSATEIASFVQAHAPEVQVSWNALRSDLIAFVYPRDYRRAGLAVFGGLMKLWRADRPAAEAALLHEIGHITNGDTLLVGVGSRFEWLACHWLLIMLIAWLLPLFPVLVVAGEYLFLGRLGSALQTVGLYLVPLLFLMPALALITLAVLLPLLVAFWCTELNADRYAVNVIRSAEPVRIVLERVTQRRRLREWLLERMTYPPLRVRRWCAQHTLGFGGSLGLLLFYPSTYIIYFAVLVVALWITTVPFGAASEFGNSMPSNIDSFLQTTLVPILLLSTCLFIAWPMIVRQRAQACFQGDERIGWHIYLVAAFITTGVAVISAVLR